MSAARTSCIIWGATGQSKVLRPILAHAGFHIAALFDNGETVVSPFAGVPLLGGWNDFEGIAADFAGFGCAVAIGGPRGQQRAEIGAALTKHGLRNLTLIHPSAFVAESAVLGKGCQILMLAAVGEEARLGEYTIVNTNASVDHECVLGQGVHVMPGATLAGCVTVEDYATIGSNATVLPRLTIGAGAIVGAGAVVTRDVTPGVTVVGNPARAVPAKSS